MKWRDRTWHYNDAATTAKPGYLKRRFAAIRKAQREKEEAERQRAVKYEATRQRAIAVRRRSEVVIASYAGESLAVRRLRHRT